MQRFAGRCLIAAGLLALAGTAVNAIWLGRPREARYRASFDQVPLKLTGALTGARMSVEQRIIEYLDADAMEDIEYQGPHGATVHLSLVYGRDWRALHSPLSCYPQQGWLVDEARDLEMAAPPGCPHPGPLRARLLRVHKANSALVAMYVFAYKGGTENDWTRQTWAVARSPRGTGGVILSMSTPVRHGDHQGALTLLQSVLSQVYLPATQFWYQ